MEASFSMEKYVCIDVFEHCVNIAESFSLPGLKMHWNQSIDK